MQIKLLINSVDRTSVLIEDSWEISDTEGSTIDTIELTLDDQDLAFTITEGEEIIVENSADATERFFAGIVSDVVVEPFGIGRRHTISAQDWKIILDRATFTKEYVSQTDLAIIQDAFTEALITEINTSTYTESARTIDRLTFRGSTLRQLMQAVTNITGYIWDVDKDKNLIYRPAGRVNAAFNFSDSPDNSTTFPYSSPLRQKEMGQFNAVEVRGAKRLSSDVTDTYSGDGTRKLFNITRDNVVSGNEYHDIFREPTTKGINDPVVVEVNTGTDGTPTWTNQDVGFEGQHTLGAAGIDVLWTPEARQLNFNTAPPNFANNSWRITGRYIMFISVTLPDDTAIAENNNRTFKKTLIEPSIEDFDTATDVAKAFLAAQGAKDRISFEFDNDGLKVDTLVEFTSSILGLTAVQYRVRRLSMSLYGGTLFNYRAVIGTGDYDLGPLLTEIREKAGRVELQSNLALTIIRMIRDAYAIGSMVVTSQARGALYYVRNVLDNGTFDGDLDDWTESIDGNHTATTTLSTNNGRLKTDAQSGPDALEVDVTASTASGNTGRYQDFPALPSQVWSFSAYVYFISLTGTPSVGIGIEWLDSGLSVLGSAAESVISSINTDFALLTLINQTAPASTAWIRVWCKVSVSASGDLAKARFDDVMAHIGAAAPGRTDNIVAGFFKAS